MKRLERRMRPGQGSAFPTAAVIQGAPKSRNNSIGQVRIEKSGQGNRIGWPEDSQNAIDQMCFS